MSIKEELAYTGLSREELAGLSGVSGRTLRNRLREPAETKLSELKAYVEVFRWNAQDLIEFVMQNG